MTDELSVPGSVRMKQQLRREPLEVPRMNDMIRMHTAKRLHVDKLLPIMITGHHFLFTVYYLFELDLLCTQLAV